MCIVLDATVYTVCGTLFDSALDCRGCAIEHVALVSFGLIWFGLVSSSNKTCLAGGRQVAWWLRCGERLKMVAMLAEVDVARVSER